MIVQGARQAMPVAHLSGRIAHQRRGVPVVWEVCLDFVGLATSFQRSLSLRGGVFLTPTCLHLSGSGYVVANVYVAQLSGDSTVPLLGDRILGGR